jgi:hypothetical protein
VFKGAQFGCTSYWTARGSRLLAGALAHPGRPRHRLGPLRPKPSVSRGRTAVCAFADYLAFVSSLKLMPNSKDENDVFCGTSHKVMPVRARRQDFPGFALDRIRGRPPLRPFLRAAAVFAGDDLRPPMRPSSASHSGPANTKDRRPETLKSRSRLSQCKPPPRPRISTARRSRTAALLRPGMSFTGKATAAPFVSWIHSARARVRYAMRPARSSVFAARRPARDARAKFERSSLSIQSGIRCDVGM